MSLIYIVVNLGPEFYLCAISMHELRKCVCTVKIVSGSNVTPAQLFKALLMMGTDLETNVNRLVRNKIKIILVHDDKYY